MEWWQVFLLALIIAACVYDVVVVVIQGRSDRSISRFLWRGLRVPAIAVAIGVILGHCGLLLGPDDEMKQDEKDEQ